MNMKTHALLFLTGAAAVLSNPHISMAEPGRYGYQKCPDIEISSNDMSQIRADIKTHHVTNPVRLKTAISIPVYFHIIQDSGFNNPATTDQISNQINVLNSAYARSNISFYVASIQEVVNDSWATINDDSQDADDMVSSLRQGDSQTLNIYLTELGDDLLGFATFPWDYEEHPELDGVVILSSTLPGGDAAPYNKGKTIVHEVGHWLGLLHTFQPPEFSDNGCKGSGDWVSDTPAEKTPHYACRRSDSCKQKGEDPIHNFMAYTPDSCQTKFTNGQRNLIQDMWEIYRVP